MDNAVADNLSLAFSINFSWINCCAFIPVKARRTITVKFAINLMVGAILERVDDDLA